MLSAKFESWLRGRAAGSSHNAAPWLRGAVGRADQCPDAGRTIAARAQPVDVPDTWGGDLLSRPRLTGDWGGLRDELGKKGIVFDVDLLMTPQVVMSGGRSTGGNFWGNVDYTLNVDTQKLGLWPGGFFKISADTGFGSNAFQDAAQLCRSTPPP